MLRKLTKKERGIFEKEPGSGVWWIRYSIEGVERREKVGRRGDAFSFMVCGKRTGRDHSLPSCPCYVALLAENRARASMVLS